MRKQYLLISFIALCSTVCSKAFWWEEVKAPKIDSKSKLDSIAGKGQFILIEFYSKGCRYCEEFYPEFNKIYELFTGKNSPRKDILIVKVDGEDAEDISSTFGVGNYPTFLLLNPYDYSFPQRYMYERDYDTMKDFLISLPKVIEPSQDPKALVKKQDDLKDTITKVPNKSYSFKEYQRNKKRQSKILPNS